MTAGRPRLFNRLSYLLIIGIIAKTLLDTTTQIFNPFLVIIGTGVGISTITMGRLVALRSIMGLTAPILGSLADRIGYRALMRISLFLTGAGMIIGGLSGNIWLFAFSMILGGIGQIGFVPNLHAYVSERLPYEKRAMGLGIIEYSWAFAAMIGMFASGLLIESFSWNTPFFVLGGGLLIFTIIFGTLPHGRPGSEHPDDLSTVQPVSGEKLNIGDAAAGPVVKIPVRKKIENFFNLGEHSKSVWANVSVSGLNMFAMMNVMIIHGAWLENEYGIGPAFLGTIGLLYGFVDLTASVFVSIFCDRIGKRRSVIFGVTFMTAAFVVFPFLNRSLALAITGILITRLGFEFAMVSNFPLLSEQIPERRGQVLGLGTLMGFAGTALAGLTGPVLYLNFGVTGLGLTSLAASVISLLLLLFVIKERVHVKCESQG